jgi:hypothetical protein
VIALLNSGSCCFQRQMPGSMADDEVVWEADEASLGQELAGNGGGSGSGSAALPEEWEELFDGASGSPYWRSPLDGTVSWVKPTAPAPTSVAGPAASPEGSVERQMVISQQMANPSTI